MTMQATKQAARRAPCARLRAQAQALARFIRWAPVRVWLSAAVMGLGQLCYGQIIKGLLFMGLEAAGIWYFIARGARDFIGFFILGTQEEDLWMGIKGDNSMNMLILGIFAIILLCFLILLWVCNIRDAAFTARQVEKGKKPRSFPETLAALADERFHIAALCLPLVTVMIFSVLPIIFMILIAFTNLGGDIVYPRLADWSFSAWKKIFSVGKLGSTFGKILTWNVLWAVSSTAINFLCGKDTIFFLTNDASAKWWARGIGLFVNAWISVPSIMLMTTGILTNINHDLYEASSLDGATPFQQFRKITLPFVVFSTTPVLIGQFVGNFNNFGIFFFIRSGVISNYGDYFLASDTDLLINWLYNLSVDNNYYSVGAAISLMIFVITATLSLTVYIRSAAYKQEDTYQ